ncbi:MAG: lipid-A-disaccharide synthase, partial [Alphaproteobacteria bacterium]
MSVPEVLKVFVVAGEESGDQLGARLMDALSAKLNGAVVYAGVGGQRMTARGLTSLFPMQDIALHGFLQVVPHIPRVLARIGTVVNAVDAVNPDIVVLIDAPGFNLRAARRIRKLH